jgi:hypothetical protein
MTLLLVIIINLILHRFRRNRSRKRKADPAGIVTAKARAVGDEFGVRLVTLQQKEQMKQYP